VKKTIGLCLAYKGTNYGALLQAYATQYAIEKIGYSTEILDYYPGKTHRFVFAPETIAYIGISKIKNKVRPKTINTGCSDGLHEKNRKMRKEVADGFRASRFHNIVRLVGFEELTRRATRYHAVIVGSDQLWEPNVAFSYFYSLRFVPKGVTRVSFATSTGVSKYPWYVKRLAAKFLKEIDYLSVREAAGQEIIKKISGRDAEIVLDPTYLHTKEEWERLIPKEEIVEPGYVLNFFLGNNVEMKELARKVAKEKGLRLVDILSNEGDADSQPVGDEILIGQTPEAFINLIRNAECIFTDSFHCFTFSVINMKQVYVSYRIRQGLASRNMRIDHIVKLFGLEKRLIVSADCFKLDEEEIDYSQVTQKIDKLRQASWTFLQKALSAGE